MIHYVYDAETDEQLRVATDEEIRNPPPGTYVEGPPDDPDGWQEYKDNRLMGPPPEEPPDWL